MNKIQMDKVIFDTMIYFTFGVTLEDDSNLIIKTIVNKAYNDATNQGAFNAKISKEDLAKKEIVETTKSTLITWLTDVFVHYKKHTNREQFQIWHNKICKKILEKYKDINASETLFTYGNAQKLLNMSLKYLYMFSRFENADMKEEFIKILNEIRADEDYLNIPMDSYIIDALWEDEQIELPLVSGNREKNYIRPSDHVKSWSNWDKEDYKKVVDSISKSKIILDNPLDWEAKNWIEQAKNRRKSI